MNYTDAEIIVRLHWLAQHASDPAIRLRAFTHWLGMRPGAATPDECRPLALALLTEIAGETQVS